MVVWMGSSRSVRKVVRDFWRNVCLWPVSFVCRTSLRSFIDLCGNERKVSLFSLCLSQNNDRLLLLACFFSSFSCLIYFRCK
jgi:hypothetical protein